MVRLTFPGFSPALAPRVSYQKVKVISPGFSFHTRSFHLLALTISFPFPPLHTHTHTHVLVYCPGFTAPVKGSAQNMTPSSAWVLPGRWDHSGVKESPHEAHGRPRPLRPQGLPEHKRRTDAGRWRGQTAGNHQVRGISGQEEDVSSYPTLLGFLHL